VGLGQMGINWLKVLLSEEQINLVSIVDLRKKHAIKLAQQFNLSKNIVYGSLDDVFNANLLVDVVIDVTPHTSRKVIVNTSLSKSCHVLSEKPMCSSISEVNELVDVASRSSRVYMVSQNYRCDNSVREIKKLILKNEIGEIYNLNVNFFLGPNFKGYRLTMDHPLLLDMAIHHFDLVRCITGSNAISVSCQEYGSKLNNIFKNDAAACVCFEMDKGFVFSYSGNWFAKGEITGWNGHWVINGSKGTICWDGDNIIKIYKKIGDGFINKLRPEEIIVAKSNEDKLSLSLKHFLTSLRTGEEPETSCRDNAYTMNMVLGAIKSSEMSKKLDLTRKPWHHD
jgi:predicted dehydrogenase